jgi:hypothetical protein
MITRLQQVTELLRVEDTEGLLSAGAPDDEYDSEAEKGLQPWKCVRGCSEGPGRATGSFTTLPNQERLLSPGIRQ